MAHSLSTDSIIEGLSHSYVELFFDSELDIIARESVTFLRSPRAKRIRSTKLITFR